MRIPCPFCGERDSAEFVFRGDASPVRPAAETGEAAFVEYVYMRRNPAGEILEHWYHAQGCRNWLVVKRNTRTHVISAATLAKTSAP
jgi:heterotetrameric sarcosine oxidase delta subunit